MYGHIRCICTVLAKPVYDRKYICCSGKFKGLSKPAGFSLILNPISRIPQVLNITVAA